MKRVIICLFSLLCIAVCSCKKEPQDLLIGNWEVSISIQYEASIGGTSAHSTADGGTWYYTFEENGHGRMVDVNDITRRYEFTYQYDGLFNSILLRRENTSKDSVLEIDILTKESFVFHSSDVATLGSLYTGTSVATYNGKKIK